MASAGEEPVLKLRSVYEPELTDDTLRFLYNLLSERDETTNISHREMPKWEHHVQFVALRPYREWWIVERNGERIGAAYLSLMNEIGIFLLKAYQGKGIGPQVIRRIVDAYGREDLIANINPKNGRSKRMFLQAEFVPLQETLIRRGSD